MSQMQVVVPNTIGEAELTASDVPLETEWSAGTFDAGDVVRVGIELYESLVDNNAAEPTAGAAADPPSWLLLGYANRWRRFTDTKDTQTEQNGQITVEVDPTGAGGRVFDTVAVLGLVGTGLTVRGVSGATVEWEEVYNLVDYGASSWWEYYFLPLDQIEDVVLSGLPVSATTTLEIEIEAGTPAALAACGLVLAGLADVIGTTLYGTQVGVINFTEFGRDGFGGLTIRPVRSVNTAIFSVTVPTEEVDYALRVLRRASKGVALYIGDDRKEATTIYGVPEEPRINYHSPPHSSLSLEVQGK